MAKRISVVLLDREPTSTDHYQLLLWEELERRLKGSRLWVAEIDVVEVVEQEPSKDAIIKF